MEFCYGQISIETATYSYDQHDRCDTLVASFGVLSDDLLNRVGNSISPIPLIYMFICTMLRSFALPEYVSNLYFSNYHVPEMNLFTNLTDIRVKHKSSDMCIYTWRTMAWDLGCY